MGCGWGRASGSGRRERLRWAAPPVVLCAGMVRRTLLLLLAPQSGSGFVAFQYLAVLACPTCACVQLLLDPCSPMSVAGVGCCPGAGTVAEGPESPPAGNSAQKQLCCSGLPSRLRAYSVRRLRGEGTMGGPWQRWETSPGSFSCLEACPCRRVL